MKSYMLILTLFSGIFTSCNKQESSSISSDKSALKNVAFSLFNSIKEKNVTSILALFDESESVYCGADCNQSYSKFKMEFLKSKEIFSPHCRLFGCNAESNSKPVIFYFNNLDKKDIELDIKFLERDDRFQFASVEYKWDGKDPELWVSELPNPIFRWSNKKGKWYLYSLFIE